MLFESYEIKGNFGLRITFYASFLTATAALSATACPDAPNQPITVVTKPGAAGSCPSQQPPRPQHEALDLLNQLRKFTNDRSKINSEANEWAKAAVEKYVRNGLIKACKQKSELISTLEYAGSLHERLKTESPDDDDVIIMVLLKVKKKDFTSERRSKHVTRLKAGPDSSYHSYADTHGYILPEQITTWFFTLLQRTAAESVDLPVKFKVINRDSVIRLEIHEKSSGRSLPVSLVPAFCVDTEYFSAGMVNQGGTADSATLWTKNFSLDEKRELQDMDKADTGCRHDVLKVVKTILRSEPTFSQLSPHKFKMAFLLYRDSVREWGKEVLHTRFLGFLNFLQEKLDSGSLVHYWCRNVNLLTGIPPITLKNMATRLRRIHGSVPERSKVLGVAC